ncbi:MAG: hypothetical protein ACXADY_25715 [Candidatus Hodarchaeales archaeon]|jgi:hypothetical protein
MDEKDHLTDFTSYSSYFLSLFFIHWLVPSLIREEIYTKIAQNGAEYARLKLHSLYKVGDHPTLKTLDKKTFSKIKALSDFLCHLPRLKYRLSEDVELIEELINESARIQEIDLSFTLDQALSSTGERLMYYWRVDS